MTKCALEEKAFPGAFWSMIDVIVNFFQAYADNSNSECIALKAYFLLQVLLLKKPSKTSKAKDHITYLQRHLESW